MPRHAACATVVILLTTTLAVAQRPYGQLGGGGGIGAQYSSGAASGAVFSAVALGFGLEWSKVFVRADARAFDTEAEPLVTLGLAVGISLLRSQSTHFYVLGAAGGGLFVAAEGDPGQHVGTGIGLTTGRPVGPYAELRYDYLVGTFTHASRDRSLVSLIVGVRIGPRPS